MAGHGGQSMKTPQALEKNQLRQLTRFTNVLISKVFVVLFSPINNFSLRKTMTPLFSSIIAPGPMELVIIAGVGLLLFGNRLPQVMRSLGKSVVEFKKGVNGIEDDIESASKESASKEKSTSNEQ